MDGQTAVQELADKFAAIDKAREQVAEDLIKAANQAFGANVFEYTGFARHVQGIDIRLTARIPCVDRGFYDSE